MMTQTHKEQRHENYWHVFGAKLFIALGAKLSDAKLSGAQLSYHHLQSR